MGESSLRWLTTAALPEKRERGIVAGPGIDAALTQVPSASPLVVSWRRRSLWFHLGESEINRDLHRWVGVPSGKLSPPFATYGRWWVFVPSKLGTREGVSSV